MDYQLLSFIKFKFAIYFSIFTTCTFPNEMNNGFLIYFTKCEQVDIC